MDDLKAINNEDYIFNLFRTMARTETSIYVDINGAQTELLFEDRRGDIPLIRLNNVDRKVENGSKIQVSLVYRDVYMKFDSLIKYISNEDKYYIEKPKTVFTSFKRILSRQKVDDNELMAFIPQTQTSVNILDVSTKGMCFVATSKIFDIGDEIHDIVIQINNINEPNQEEITVDALVKHYLESDNNLCKLNHYYRVEFTDISWASYYKLFLYIFNKEYPNVKFLHDFSEEQIHELFVKSGYMKFKSIDEMEYNFKMMMKNSQVLKTRPEIGTDLVYYKDDKLAVTGSLLRIYNKTFLGHQLAALPDFKMNMDSKLNVYYAAKDLLLNNPYFENYLAYYDAREHWHVEMYKKISDLINDKDKMICEYVSLLDCSSEAIISYDHSKYNIKLLTNKEEFLRYCESNLSKLERSCYCYNEHVDLTEIKQIYILLNLYLDRQIWGVYKNDKVIAYIVAESYSNGLNLCNLLNMCKIYLIDEIELEQILKISLYEVSLFYKKHKNDDFALLIKLSDISIINNINLPGVRYSIYYPIVGKIIMNANGLSEYKKILLTRFPLKYY